MTHTKMKKRVLSVLVLHVVRSDGIIIGGTDGVTGYRERVICNVFTESHPVGSDQIAKYCYSLNVCWQWGRGRGQ